MPSAITTYFLKKKIEGESTMAPLTSAAFLVRIIKTDFFLY